MTERIATTLILAEDGPSRRELESLAHRLGLDLDQLASRALARYLEEIEDIEPVDDDWFAQIPDPGHDSLLDAH